MCCGKMIRLLGKRERTMLTTGDISIDLDKIGGLNDNIKTNKREFNEGQTQAQASNHKRY